MTFNFVFPERYAYVVFHVLNQILIQFKVIVD